MQVSGGFLSFQLSFSHLLALSLGEYLLFLFAFFGVIAAVLNYGMASEYARALQNISITTCLDAATNDNIGDVVGMAEGRTKGPCALPAAYQYPRRWMFCRLMLCLFAKGLGYAWVWRSDV